MAKKEWLAKGADGLSFGERLGDLISKKGITQAELAKVTGIGQSRLSDYIAGKQIDKENDERLYAAPDCATVITLAKFFSVSTDYLLGVSKEPSPSMDIRTVCDYTGLSGTSAEYLHAHRASRTGFLTRLIDGILCEPDLDTKVPQWILQSAQAGALASVESDFADDRCDIENKISYVQRKKDTNKVAVNYAISAHAACDFYLQRAITKATSKVAEIVLDMRNDVLIDICKSQSNGIESFQWITPDDSEIEGAKNGHD